MLSLYKMVDVGSYGLQVITWHHLKTSKVINDLVLIYVSSASLTLHDIIAIQLI